MGHRPRQESLGLLAAVAQFGNSRRGYAVTIGANIVSLQHTMALAAATRLGAYEIVGPLGAGGMGEVYRARDTKLQRDVAIKILPAPVANDRDRLARFEREARVLASLNHPNIGSIYGIEDTTEFPALVLELVDGPTLADRLAAARLPLHDCVAIARQIAEALEYAHEHGIVHRDLKPANIKVNSDGVVKVLDFGLAKAVAPDAADLANSPTLTVAETRDGVILGTASYMSPEQARGHLVDKRTDVWAFGCVLYEMLTGRLAFGGTSTSDVIVAVLERQPDYAALPDTTPEPIRRLLRRTLEKDVRRRVRDIGDARLELEDAASPPGPARAELPPDVARTWRRRLAAASVLTAAATAVVVSAAWWLARASRHEPPAFSRVVRLVSTPAHEFGPAISPDGKWVAYLSNARGPTDVWVRFLNGGEPVNLTGAAGITIQNQDYIGGLDISPDGSLIAFSAGPGGAPHSGFSTWVIPAPLGGVPRRLLDPPNQCFRWSPDGTRATFMRPGGSAGDALFVADADGQNAREVVKAEGGIHIHWPRWSADGRFVYFNHGVQNGNAEPTGIARVPATGGPVETIVRTSRRAIDPFPSPDGRGLYYAANPDSVDLGIWWRDLTTNQDHRLTSGVGEYTAPYLSASGERLVGTVVETREVLARVRLDTTAEPTIEPLTDGYSGDLDPSWSPSGDRVVFSSSRTGQRNLWSVGPELTGPAPVTVGAAFDTRPAFSPDGRQIAFVSDRGGRRGVWLMAADGGTSRLLAVVDVLDGVSWSPDGRRLVAAVPGAQRPGLVLIDTRDGRTTPVPLQAGASAPQWSPVADAIAYLEPRGALPGTFLRITRSDGQPLLVDTPGEPSVFTNGTLAWSADGRRIAVVGLPTNVPASLWVVEPGNATGSARVLDFPSGTLVRGIAWARDGRSLILGLVRWNGDIILAENQASAR